MLEIVEFGVDISFFIKFEDDGLSKSALLGLNNLAKENGCHFQFYSEDTRYTIRTWGRLLSKDLVISLIDNIRKLAGIDLIFNVEIIKNMKITNYTLDEYISTYND